MQQSSLIRTIGVSAVTEALLGMIAHWLSATRPSSVRDQPVGDEIQSPAALVPPKQWGHVRPAHSLEVDNVSKPSVDYDWRRALREMKSPPKLPRQVVEAFVELRQRSVESLLAAHHALEDTNYLAEAALRFPDDSRVQWTMLARDLSPVERHQWLDRFEMSCPDNSLADYLSAQNHLSPHYDETSGRWLFGPDKLPTTEFLLSAAGQAAINDLLEATSKPGFKDFALETRLEEEEMHLAAGRSVLQARLAANGWSADLLPELEQVKSIVISLQELAKYYLANGDSASAAHLTEMGLTLAARLRVGERSKLFVNQLVGTASEAILLRAWDSTTTCDFLGGRTPQDRLVELQAERAGFRALDEALHGCEAELPEKDLVAYLDRKRIYGEVEAMRWLQQRIQPAPPH